MGNSFGIFFCLKMCSFNQKLKKKLNRPKKNLKIGPLVQEKWDFARFWSIQCSGFIYDKIWSFQELTNWFSKFLRLFNFFFNFRNIFCNTWFAAKRKNKTKLQKMAGLFFWKSLVKSQMTFNRHKKPFLNSGTKVLSVKVLL